MKICKQTNSHFDCHFHYHSHHHNPGHHYNLFCLYNIFHQLTAKLKIGRHGPTAVRPAEVEPRPEVEELFKRQRMEELSVQLWRKRNLATLTNVKVQSTAKLRIGHRGVSVE